MRTWKEATRNALRLYVTQKDKYVYFYGAKGQVMTEKTMDALIDVSPAYFAKYSATEIEQIKRNSLGKIGYDCSGFTGWGCTGDKTYSTGQFGHASYKTENLASGVAGSLLYTTYGGRGRHIGIDVGGGYFMDMAYESTDKNIAEGKAGIRLCKISDNVVPWEWSFQSAVVDYTGSSADATMFSKTPKWVAEVASNYIDVFTLPNGKSLLKDYPHLAKTNLVDVCDTMTIGAEDDWSYIRIARKYFGFVRSEHLKLPEEAKKDFLVGEIVNFVGTKQYTSSYVTGKEVEAKPCIAAITKVAKENPHPYHVVGSGVHGWADAEDLSAN